MFADPPSTVEKVSQFTFVPGGVAINTAIAAKISNVTMIGTKSRRKYTSFISGSIYLGVLKNHVLIGWRPHFSVHLHFIAGMEKPVCQKRR
jgi:hypothetical protein